jgi:hypothetical protein
MPFTVSFNMVQVIDIAEAEDRLLDLYNTMLIDRGQMHPSTDEVDAVVFEVLGELEAYLQGLAREGGLRGRDLKPIVQAWVEERLTEAGAGSRPDVT